MSDSMKTACGRNSKKIEFLNTFRRLMGTSNGMSFWIALYGKDGEIVSDDVLSGIVLNKVTNGIIHAPADLPHTCFYDEIVWLIDSFELHAEQLQAAGICKEESSIWMVYEYFTQCNMEFDPAVLSRIGKSGLKLCVSCYQDDTLANRESFDRTLVCTPRNGIILSLTIGADIKESETFSIRILVENNRESEPFILTSLAIDNAFLANFESIEYSGMPLAIIEESEAKSIYLDKIIKSKEKFAFEVMMLAPKQGVYRGRLRVQENGHYIEESIIVVVGPPS